MACEAVYTGQRFVAQTLAHVDCQAQAIGAYGYGALADPASGVSLALTALLTVFVALFGLRLMTGAIGEGRDVLGDALRLGIVLTLATSWPAWRTVGYDLVMKGPAELASVIGGVSDLPGSGGDLVARLQSADDGIVLLTVYGTGRNTGGTERSDTIGDSFRGIALADQEGLANGRIWFLAGVIGPLALVRLGAGLLLALAPLMAGLLLFAGTRDLFFGWLRALGMLALGALALTAIYGVELAILDPWVRDALALRESQTLTPSIPTELSVITLSFALASFGVLVVIGKIMFFGGFSMPRLVARFAPGQGVGKTEPASERGGTYFGQIEPPSRAFVVAEAVAQTLRREERVSDRLRTVEQSGGGFVQTAGAMPTGRSNSDERRGASYDGSGARRFRRSSAAGDIRDRKR